jgi:hypothetical protein
MLPDDSQIPSLEEQLNRLDLSTESRSRQQIYRRLQRQAARPIYRQPLYVTLFSRLGAAVLLALVFGVFVGAMRFQSVFPALTVTVISSPHLSPAVTPGTAIVAEGLPQTSHPRPLPTPLAPTVSHDNTLPVLRTGTQYP